MACLLSPNKVAASLNDRYSLSLKSDMGCSLMTVWTLVSTSCILFCRTASLYAKYHNIPKVKKGKYTLISQPELDKLLAAPKIE
jgi:hypothetical protein